ncbi:MAG: DUF4132 domain-containing protein, partial [bacterium]|nr:DUF4132 domain-containing protein [bacterium]
FVACSGGYFWHQLFRVQNIHVFMDFLVNHPLVCHLSRRLVWGIYNNEGLKTTFRVAEDNSFTGMNDEDFQLEKEVEIGIPHPIELPGNVPGGWGTVFADYEILQPFPQLGREVYHQTDEYRDTSSLDIVKGIKVPSGAIRGLEDRGWRKGVPQDAGLIWEYEKYLPGGCKLDLEFDPGIFAGGYEPDYDEQTLGLATLRKGEQEVHFKILAPIIYSELFRDLISLKS